MEARVFNVTTTHSSAPITDIFGMSLGRESSLNGSGGSAQCPALSSWEGWKASGGTKPQQKVLLQ